MSHHPDIPLEQAHLDAIRQRIAQLRHAAKDALDRTLLHRIETPQEFTERDVRVKSLSTEISRYDQSAIKLCFGRIDHADHQPSLHIGRIGVRAQATEDPALLTDWRAPAARPFYLATTLHPLNISRRRHLTTSGPLITDVHDEILSGDDHDRRADVHESMVGEAALRHAVNAARTGQMQDIVSTIQREQDLIIRHTTKGVLIVQGGPGTGKTAVALHRVAYLIYTYRDILEHSGVLVIGPNSEFLDYISHVLPSLGETSVALSTVDDLYPGVQATASDSLISREVKGSLAMAEIVARAVKNIQQVPTAATTIDVDGEKFSIPVRVFSFARTKARRSRKPHNIAFDTFHHWCVKGIVDEMVSSYETQFSVEESSSLLSSADVSEMTEEVTTSPDVCNLIDSLWPRMLPTDFIQGFLTDLPAIQAAASEYSSTDHNAIFRPEFSGFSAADVALIDEAAELMGDTTRTQDAREAEKKEQLLQAQEALDILKGSASIDIEDEIDPEVLMAYDIIDADSLAARHSRSVQESVAERALADRQWTYGHIVIDEAQELSPMQWRMVMRKSPNRWLTIVGDTAQTSNPAGVDDWSQSLQPFVKQRFTLAELSVNYRTPAPITALANKIASSLHEDFTPADALRTEGPTPRVIDCTTTDLESVISALRTAAHCWESTRAVAIIFPRATDLHSVTPHIVQAFPQRSVSVLNVDQCKGLEFDHVTVVSAAEIVEQSPMGLNDLFVCITRATQTMDFIGRDQTTDWLCEE